MRFPRVRVSIRQLLITILIIGLVLGAVMRRVKLQRDAVAAIRSAGGSVIYSWQWKNRQHDPFSTLGWLLDRIPPDYLYAVKQVALVGGQGDKANDHLMAYVGQLTGLERLNLNGSKGITDIGLAELRNLNSLTELDLTFTQVTGAGFVHLRGLTALKRLDIGPTTFSDADLANLKGLTDLKWLQILDESNGNKLTLLFLDGTKITDAGLTSLTGLKACTQITIGKTAVTSAGAAKLQQIRPKTRGHLDGNFLARSTSPDTSQPSLSPPHLLPNESQD